MCLEHAQAAGELGQRGIDEYACVMGVVVEIDNRPTVSIKRDDVPGAGVPQRVIVVGDAEYCQPALCFGLAVGLETQKGRGVARQAVLEEEFRVWGGEGGQVSGVEGDEFVKAEVQAGRVGWQHRDEMCFEVEVGHSCSPRYVKGGGMLT